MRTRTEHGQFAVTYGSVCVEPIEFVVSRLGLEPRALALKAQIDQNIHGLIS